MSPDLLFGLVAGGSIGFAVGTLCAPGLGYPWPSKGKALQSELNEALEEQKRSAKRNADWSNACGTACDELFALEAQLAKVRRGITPHTEGDEPKRAPEARL